MTPRVRGRRLWCRVQAHGGTIPVYVSKTDLKDDEGVAVNAYFDHAVPCIVIRQYESATKMQMLLHHELLHVCFGAHSGDALAAVLGPRTPEGRARREEAIVSFLEPVQFDLLVRNGFLKYPKPPKMP